MRKIFEIEYDENTVGKGVVSCKNILTALRSSNCYYHPDIYSIKELPMTKEVVMKISKQKQKEIEDIIKQKLKEQACEKCLWRFTEALWEAGLMIGSEDKPSPIPPKIERE